MSDHNLPQVNFTREMKETHTIIVPMMLEIHFGLIEGIFRREGYKTALLRTTHKGIAEEGLRNVHNDTCYPALLLIGQIIDALKSGDFDLDKVAVLMTQTGGGCRASNYLSLLRKALHKNNFGHVPVAFINVSSPTSEGGLYLSKRALMKIITSLVYSDLLMLVKNQCVPYETEKGATKAAVDKWIERLNEMRGGEFKKVAKNCDAILKDFAAIPRAPRTKKRVGIVGEIYIKYSPLGNNGLENYLVEQGAEVVNSGMLEFLLYRLHSMVHECRVHGGSFLRNVLSRVVTRYAHKKQRDLIRAVKKEGTFEAPPDFAHTVKMCEGYLDLGVKMGEGWLLTAEMLELIHIGVNNIVAVQPFGCLPNHIVAKGMSRKIKDNFPHANIVTLDYDPGASIINQENRLRLMLANAD